MTSLATELPLPGLPSFRGMTGPATAMRQRRTWLIYLGLVAFGALPWAIGASPAWCAFGLGLWVPGGGFIALGGWWSLLVLPAAILFVASLVAWFWAGAVVAPVLVWLGAALLAAGMATDAPWPGSPVVVAALVVAVGFAFARANGKARARGAARALVRQAFLPASYAEVAAQARGRPDDARRELDADQLAGLRYLLDRALQPVGSFDGFTVIDQFQPAALRYQINHMGFALGIAQRAYLPAFRGYMGLAQRNLIEKYLERKVWDYWVLESCWGHLNFTDWNPAARDNIMLTGWFAAHVGQYMLATGDRRYMEPGSLTFRLNRRQSWAHDFTTIVGSVSDNYARADFGLFACEPNWIYPICNHYGMLALVTHDALTGSKLVDRHLPGWIRGLDTEFTDASGSIVGLRSQFTGLPVPFPVGEAGYSHFANCFMPDRARQFWAIARREIEPLIVAEDDGGSRIAMPGAGLDAGHYKPGHVGAYASYLVAAREFGDRERADAALRGLERDCRPDRSDGVMRYLTGSNISNATAIMGLLMDTGDFRRSFTEPLPETRLAGPMIESMDYPDVLVARAWSDGSRLEAVLLPGRGARRKAVPLSQLVPGARYRVVGAQQAEVTASPEGEAVLDVVLDGRIEIIVEPLENLA